MAATSRCLFWTLALAAVVAAADRCLRVAVVVSGWGFAVEGVLRLCLEAFARTRVDVVMYVGRDVDAVLPPFLQEQVGFLGTFLV